MAENPEAPSADTHGQGEYAGEMTPPFFLDPVPGQGWSQWISCEYDALSDVTALGDDANGDRDARRCFNCGSPYHILDDCPKPRNRDLIALSRQFFNFFNSAKPLRRIHEVEQWKRQRLEWLETFEPGRIQGPSLREALGLEDGDIGEHLPWLRNMADWGYPQGWVGHEDPRLRVWRIIMDEEQSAEEPEEEASFMIHGEHEESEELDLTLVPSATQVAGRSRSPSINEEHAASDLSEGQLAETADSGLPGSPRRWATYPETYFSSSLLPVYKGERLPPVAHVHEVSSTFSADREALWQQIISQDRVHATPGHNPASIPPWRLPGAFLSPVERADVARVWASPPPPSFSHSPPPPPSTTPPPLPEAGASLGTPTNLLAAPLMHHFCVVPSDQPQTFLHTDPGDFTDNVDMEISDSE
ncbi:hypothetical protein NM688_g2378 [Phlebia brevispora]|uniref:Uncharacterized protein n=1 Tax=Phlebia brevispora TaxID=194682 RepID=A0ACC1T8Z1_9APHY|nr:hypothetical protein NM688_g2378 [Phlebia brevispora]